jgi:hypothetical protein
MWIHGIGQTRPRSECSAPLIVFFREFPCNVLWRRELCKLTRSKWQPSIGAQAANLVVQRQHSEGGDVSKERSLTNTSNSMCRGSDCQSTIQEQKSSSLVGETCVSLTILQCQRTQHNNFATPADPHIGLTKSECTAQNARFTDSFRGNLGKVTHLRISLLWPEQSSRTTSSTPLSSHLCSAGSISTVPMAPPRIPSTAPD